MKILFISNYAQLYGANRSLLSIIEKCKNSGCEVCLFLPRKGNYTEELERKQINYKVIPYFSQLFYYRNSISSLIVPFWDIWTFCVLPYVIIKAKKYRPDLIYSNTAAENIGILVANALKIKHITHVREFMDLDHRFNFFFGKKAKRNYICKSDAVIYVSKSVAYHTLMSEVLPNNHKVIYNGVHCDNEAFKEKRIPQCINFGIVGLLDESKGQDMAICYFNKIKDDYPNSKLHIWGDKDGGYKKKLYDLISKLELQDRVIMHGFEKNPSTIYGDMHVLLMCSKAEGFGRVTVEAMMRGIPVLGYNSGGTAEIIKHEYSGFIFNTEEEFVDDVHKLFISDERYNSICLNAFNDSHTRFSEEKYSNEVMTFIDNLMK